MRQVLLDTDICSEIMRGRNPEVMANLTRYRTAHAKLTISVVTVVEISFGLRRVNRLAQLRSFADQLSEFDLLTLDDQAALVAGNIMGELQARGAVIGWADTLIASIAIKNDLPVATGNTRHYDRVRQCGYPLALFDWRIAPADGEGS